MSENQRTCFVVMGFGKKTDFESGRTLDLDKTYYNIIKPAITEAGYACLRADEIVHSGLIDVPMYRRILEADIVVADLSTSNRNAYYELGVRHALRPFTTIVISEDGAKSPPPFDVSHVAIRSYHHLGEDIGYSEVVRFKKLLKEAVEKIPQLNREERVDSPVYKFLQGLVEPSIPGTADGTTAKTEPADARKALAEAGVGGRAVLAAQQEIDVNPLRSVSHRALMAQADTASQKGDFPLTKAILTAVVELMKAQRMQQNPPGDMSQEEVSVIQRLALATYKSKSPTEPEALVAAREILEPLNPATSNDTETLGLWGAVHKRLHEATGERTYLDDAIRAYERGYYLRNDHYNAVNFAFLLDRRADLRATAEEKVADFVLARRIRREVVRICDEWLSQHPLPRAPEVSPQALQQAQHERYWVLASQAEAHFGLGARERSDALLKGAEEATRPLGWMRETTTAQLTKLTPLLQNAQLTLTKLRTCMATEN